MVSAKTVIINPQGMHMRPAQLFTSTVGKFPCQVNIVVGDRVINAKSIMHLMAACLKTGTEIEIQCSGEREEEALQAAVELVKSGLGDL